MISSQVQRPTPATSLLVWIFGFLGLLLSGSVVAYTNQWEWKVVKVFSGSESSPGFVINGAATIYPTKQAALAAMRQLTGSGQLLTVESGVANPTSTWVQYRYTTPSPQPAVVTAWSYSWGLQNKTYAGSPEPSPGPFTSEAAVLAAFDTAPDSYWVCVGPHVRQQITDWARSTGGRDDVLDVNQSRAYTYNHGPPPSGQGSCGQQILTVKRQRSINCPQYYAVANVGGAATCLAPAITGVIQGHLIECASTGPSTKVGNPCDAATGGKSHRETDYAGPLLSFERFYESASLISSSSLGDGWTHSYARRLVMTTPTSTQPKLLVRPNGHQDMLSVRPSSYVAQSGSGVVVTNVGGQWVAHLGDGRREVYNTAGKLVQLIDSGGAATAVSYDIGGNLSTVIGPFGHSLTFTYQNDAITAYRARLIGITDSAGQSISYSYTNGQLSGVLYPDGRTRIYHYENASFPNLLTGITDESGTRFATYTYDSSGRVTVSEHAGGSERVTLTYNSTNTVVNDAAGGSATFAFVANSTLTRRTSSVVDNGRTSTFAVPSSSTDPQRRVTQVTDARGAVTKYVYSPDAMTSLTEAFGTANARTRTFQYRSTDDDLPTLITEPNRTTAYTYTPSGRPLTVTATDTSAVPNLSRTWSNTYDTYGRLLTTDGPRTDVSDVTTYTYYTCTTGSQCGQVATVTNALSQVTTYNTYNLHGQPLTITDPNGVVTTLTYDTRQRLASRSVNGETTTIEYWPTGLLKKTTLPDSSHVLYTYDGAQRLIKIEDNAGNRIEYTLDAMGQRTAENAYDPSSALRRTHTQVFNTLNQLWKDVNAAGTAAVTTVFTYDNNQNVTGIAAPLSRTTAQQFDELNRLKQITDPALGVTQMAYDPNDNLTTVIDPKGLVTSYQYNGFGDVKQLTSPDTGVTTNTYDSAGNLATSTDARSAVATSTYDALNRLASVAYGDQTISYGYDAGTNGKGRLTSAADANHSLSWAYDAQGRVTGKGQTVGGVTQSIGYGYTNGKLISITTPSGQTVTYGYASNGQVSSISINGNTLLSQVLYEPFGPARQWTWGNSTLTVRTYDTDGKVTQVDSGGLKTYGYDDAFRITGITDSTIPANSWAHAYDAMDRLTSATSSAVTQGWTYDGNGNRLTEIGSTPSTYTYASGPNSNRLAAITGALPRTYGYDAAGNTLNYSGVVFTYNNRGRMASADYGGNTATYIYNALGQRVKRTASTGTNLYMYDEAGHLIGEYDGAGNLVQETVWFGDIPVSTLRPNGGSGIDVFYVHSDHLNTPRLVTQPSNNAERWRWDSDPFGTTMANENPATLGVFKYNLRFPGQQYDGIAGLYYNYFRDYDAGTGRYVESDPIGLDGGLNTFVYAGANTLSYFDASGESPIAIPLAELCLGNPACAVPAGAATGVALTCLFNPDLCKTASALACEDVSNVVNEFLKPLLSQDKKLTPGDIKKLKEKGHNPEVLKGGKRTGQRDLFKDKKGNIVVKPKDGSGPGDPTGININEL